MLVQFLTDDQIVRDGFRAKFHYIPIEPNCANWLNLTAQLLKSSDNPTINCSWVITAPLINDDIVIHFETFEVTCSSSTIRFKKMQMQCIVQVSGFLFSLSPYNF